ncbi:hypothetical protein D3C71_1938110 [compost metagenome]
MGNAHGFFAQCQDTVGITEKVMAHRRKAQSLFFTDKQIGAQFLFELTQACGQVRGDAVQLLCGTGDGAGFGDAAKHAELGQIHYLLFS